MLRPTCCWELREGHPRGGPGFPRAAVSPRPRSDRFEGPPDRPCPCSFPARRNLGVRAVSPLHGSLSGGGLPRRVAISGHTDLASVPVGQRRGRRAWIARAAGGSPRPPALGPDNLPSPGENGRPRSESLRTLWCSPTSGGPPVRTGGIPRGHESGAELRGGKAPGRTVAQRQALPCRSIAKGQSTYGDANLDSQDARNDLGRTHPGRRLR